MRDIDQIVARRRGWITLLLALVALLAAIDRQAFAVLLVPIQRDLKVSDAAMGALTGATFAVVYALMALPLARLADRINRRNLLAGAVAIWSAATMLCGAASGYLSLLLIRIGVAGAESAQMPTTMSLIGDVAPPVQRGGTIGWVIVGSTAGYSLGSILAGWLNDAVNWRGALMIVGLPGLLLSALVMLTLPEPRRGAQDGAAAPPVQEPLIPALRRCAAIPTLAVFALGNVFLQACYQGWLVWVPPFLMRVHGLSSTRMGAVFGGVIGASMLSNIVAGVLSDRLARRGPRWSLYLCCIMIAVSSPFLIASSLMPGLAGAIACLVVYTFTSGGITTAAAVVYLSVAPPQMRGFVTALMALVGNVVGALGGPLLFGACNDVLKLTFGDQSLRYTLLLAPAMFLVAGGLFLLASRTIEADVKAARAG